MPCEVSVLLPVYNAAAYLPSALASLEPDLDSATEVIAVDDGSTDASGAILDRWAARRRRVLVVHQENARLVAALQTAAAHSEGAILARMDADDVNVPGRIPATVAALRRDSRLVLVSPWAQQVTEDGTPGQVWRYPWDAHALSRSLYLDNPIIHGAVAMRRDAFDGAGGYRQSMCEDYDLWDRMSVRGAVALIPEVFYRYRVGANSHTSRHAVQQAADAASVRQRRWDRRPPSLTGLPMSVARYRRTDSKSLHRGHLRSLAALSRSRRDWTRFAVFAAAYAAA